MLTRRQEKFCREYHLSAQGADAARKPGYSCHTARTIASRLLTVIDVKKEVMRLEEIDRKRYQISKDKIVRKYWDIIQSTEKDSSKINALNGLSKVLGYVRDTAVQQIEIFSEAEEKIKKRLAQVIGRQKITKTT